MFAYKKIFYGPEGRQDPSGSDTFVLYVIPIHVINRLEQKHFWKHDTHGNMITSYVERLICLQWPHVWVQTDQVSGWHLDLLENVNYRMFHLS